VEVEERRAGSSSDKRFAGDEDPTGVCLPIPLLLRLLGVFVFGSDHDFTNSIFLQQLLGVHVYTHVFLSF
jgi:hypothetical protein